MTDEIFGISIARPGPLEPRYHYGAMAVAVPAWAVGTALGILMGNILPARVVSALGVGLFGMFISIFIPPARKNRVIAGLVIVSFAASYAFNAVAWFDGISSGMKIIILTVAISLGAALLFPVEGKEDGHGA